jgi:polysaccharide export outer membrane protein
MILLTAFTAGCRGPNHFLAETMPGSLRLASRSNPQEVDLSRLASATGSSETIGPGDILEVSIAASLIKDDQVTLPVRVADDGSGILPDIGKVQLGGVEPHAAEQLIRLEAIRKGLYRSPNVTVQFAHKRLNRITVLGAVKEPTVVELPPGRCDIVSAIAAAGGLAEDAGEHVEIRNPIRAQPSRRPAIAGEPNDPYLAVSDSSDGSTNASNTTTANGKNSYTINLISAAKAGSGSYMLEDGGVVMVEKRDPLPITVMGLVREPGPVEYPVGKDLHVLDAVALAGGIRNQLADKVYVRRPLASGGDPAVIEISLRKAERSDKSNVRLGPGDVVTVKQTPATVMLEALQIVRFGLSGSVGTLF